MDLQNEFEQLGLVDAQTHSLFNESNAELTAMLTMLENDDTLKSSTRVELADLLIRLNT